MTAPDERGRQLGPGDIQWIGHDLAPTPETVAEHLASTPAPPSGEGADGA